MSAVWQSVTNWSRSVAEAWDRFWFTPADPATLSLIRVFAGLMLLYTHAVWSIDLEAFFGRDAWISQELLATMWQQDAAGQGSPVYFWTYFTWIKSPAQLWAVHIAALLVFAMLAVGLFSRTSAVLAYLIALSYLHRAQGALFGLDQINLMLALYLIVGPCGARYSLDRWIATRRRPEDEVAPAISANIAIRLIQLHMCVIYFYAGTRKLTGGTWWDGTAMWGSIANLEYQSIDMTWLAAWPLTLAFFTHLTIWFEISYPALVWHPLTRPVVLLLAVLLHLGIALCMGMITFGLAMLIANLAFVPPLLVRAIMARLPQIRAAAT